MHLQAQTGPTPRFSAHPAEVPHTPRSPHIQTGMFG